MKSTLEFKIRLQVQAPYFSSSQSSQQFGIDSALLRDLDGKPALAGSALRGLLRNAWDELNEHGLGADIGTWLGHENAEIGSRSAMRFSHWFSLDDGTSNHESSEVTNTTDKTSMRYRIEVSKNGTVKRGSLQTIEAPFNTGETLSFEGTIFVTLATNDESELKEAKEKVSNCLTKGLNWIPCVGGLNGIGFGKLIEAEVTEVSSQEKNSDIQLSHLDNDSCGIELSFDRPICFAKPQQGKSEGNLFEASDTIPGAAIIAVLARQLASDNHLIDCLRVSHAFPCEKESTGAPKRPFPIPYSWAYLSSSDEAPQDIARIAPEALKGTPTFLLDWKYPQFKTANKMRGWPDINKFEETRTAISKTRAAASNKLFSTQLIDARNLVWRANIDFSDVPAEDRAKLKSKLKQIMAMPLAPFGKTDAQADIQLYPAFSYSKSNSDIDNALKQEEITLTLATDAQLFHTLPTQEQACSPESWRQAYQALFDRLAPNVFSITRQFCREKLVGGNYINKRFDKDKPNYLPRLLTEAGSVFVLKVLDKEQAKTALSKWLTTGIPLLEGNDNWKTSPYRNFNGYGEVILNLQLPEQGGAK